MAVVRCEKHGFIVPTGQAGCHRCMQEAAMNKTPEEKFALREKFRQIAEEVLPFGAKLKKRLIDLDKIGKKVRVACPNPEHEKTTYVWAMLVPRGGREPHLHFACEEEGCHYRMME